MRPTALHSRSSRLSVAQRWNDWAGYSAAASYLQSHLREYWAIRTSAALFDMSPMFKLEVTGPEARFALNRFLTRDISKLAPGRVAYSAWLDDDGYLLQDGNLVCLDDETFRLTAAEPVMRWLSDCARGFDVEVSERSERYAMLALQGPRSRAILSAVTTGADLDRLRYFSAASARVGGAPVTITRTGFTGDLGYELVVQAELATMVWDALYDSGRGHALLPAGLEALDVARIEAGLPLIGVDWIPADLAWPLARRVLPHEVGMGWTVEMVPDNDFLGRPALEKRFANSSFGKRAANDAAPHTDLSYVGLVIEWANLEEVYGVHGVRPDTPGHPACRTPVPVYCGSRQVGQATSHVFSPLIRKQIALASIDSDFAQLGSTVEVEMTVEYERRLAPARIVGLPFFNPKRKRAVRKRRPKGRRR